MNYGFIGIKKEMEWQPVNESDFYCIKKEMDSE
jgi:hypothetical protein